MKKWIKVSLVSLVALCLSVMTVMCCCIAQAAAAHLHQRVLCPHCAAEHSSQSQAPFSDGHCKYQLTHAEILHAQGPSAFSVASFAHALVLRKDFTAFSFPSSLLGYPRGSPPQISLIPFYLRGFALRI